VLCVKKIGILCERNKRCAMVIGEVRETDNCTLITFTRYTYVLHALNLSTSHYTYRRRLTAAPVPRNRRRC
jgi:hypothetical protein